MLFVTMLLPDEARQRHQERLRQAEEHRLARLVRARRPRAPARIRWNIADGLMRAGERLRRDQDGT